MCDAAKDAMDKLLHFDLQLTESQLAHNPVNPSNVANLHAGVAESCLWKGRVLASISITQ